MRAVKEQPERYTEIRAGRKAGFMVYLPGTASCCFTCAHKEPFGEARYVAWCAKHGGHVPMAAVCDSYEMAPGNPS